MAVVQFDAKGLRCPAPTLRMTVMLMKREVKPGDILEVVADCPAFPSDVKKWCETWSKSVLLTKEEGAGVVRCQIKI